MLLNLQQFLVTRYFSALSLPPGSAKAGETAQLPFRTRKAPKTDEQHIHHCYPSSFLNPPPCHHHWTNSRPNRAASNRPHPLLQRPSSSLSSSPTAQRPSLSSS